MKWIVKPSQAGMTINDYLRNVHHFSRRIITAIKFDGGEIKVNDKKQTVRYCLQSGDQLFIKWPSEHVGENLKPESLPLDIIYEDDDILVLDKPTGIAVLPSPNQPKGSIANRILGYYGKQNIPYTVHIVTRLDRDTSGLLLVAKHRYSHSLLSMDQQAGKVSRQYQAIIHGHLKQKQGVINAPIARKKGSIIERTVHESGKKAVTAYSVLEETKKHTLLDVTLKTGRTHQIRVHFSSIGYPLVGDDLYGGSTTSLNRQALHCSDLCFKHPLTKEELSYHLPIPLDMKHLMREDILKDGLNDES